MSSACPPSRVPDQNFQPTARHLKLPKLSVSKVEVFIRLYCVSGTVNTRGMVPALTEPAVHLPSPLVSLPSCLLSPTLEAISWPIHSSHCPVSCLVPSPWSTSLSISSFASLLTLLWFSGFLIAFFSFLKIVVRTLNMRSTPFTS